MNNSYLITDTSVSLLIAGNPYVVSKSHDNIEQILAAIRGKEFDTIPALINRLAVIKDQLDNIQSANGDVVIDIEGGIVTCQGSEIPFTLTKRIIRMVQEGFDVGPMSCFISNLFNNPSSSTIDDLYKFLEHGQLPITEDGFFVAYKRVKGDYTDCHTGTVLNKPTYLMEPEEHATLSANPVKADKVTTRIDENGQTEVSMPRRAVDDRSEQTCSRGLHFCSFDYLASFSGERVIAVKINPADVVSIPVDYNNTKGRCCKYVVLNEITDREETLTEKSVYCADPAGAACYNEGVDDPSGDEDEDHDDSGTTDFNISAPWVPSDNPTDDEKLAYVAGYYTGRARAAREVHSYMNSEYSQYYVLGYKHGRGKQRKLFVSPTMV